MLGQISVTAVFIACAAGLQLQGRNDYAAQECYTGEKVYFVHVMKTGGSSVDELFGCLGKEKNFAVQYVEGPVNITTGDTSCPAAVCTAHQALADQDWICDSEFQNASTFTMLREPIARTFSLFNYDKYELQRTDMEEFATFGDLLRNLEEHPYESAFSNNMVDFYFAPNAVTLSLAHGDRAEVLMRSNYQATQGDLETAKSMLKKVDAIFFNERMSTWQDDYKNSGLPLAEEVGGSSSCWLGNSKKADCEKDGCAKEATDEEVELATKLNSLDIELYEFAKTLPQALGSDP